MFIVKLAKMVFYDDLQMYAITCMHILHNRIWVLPIVEDPTVTAKCRTAIKELFLYLNLCLSVMLNILSCSFYINIFSYLFLDENFLIIIITKTQQNWHTSSISKLQLFFVYLHWLWRDVLYTTPCVEMCTYL